MKQILPTIFAILLLAVVPVFSQEATKWLRIEFEDKKFSAAVPLTNIIDTEKRDYYQHLRIVAFENGVEIVITHSKSKIMARVFTGKSDSKNTNITSFKVGDFTVIKPAPMVSDGNRIRHSVTIIRDDNVYSMLVHSKTGKEKEVERFLLSIKIQGIQLIVKNEETNFPENILAVSNLKTSPEIVEAEKRKTGKVEGKITYELQPAGAVDVETQDLAHRALIIEKPIPRFPTSIDFQTSFIKLRVQLRADGQIGDIVVLSNADEGFTKNSINSARRIKFVPARRGGEFVDSFQIVTYSMLSLPLPTVIFR